MSAPTQWLDSVPSCQSFWLKKRNQNAPLANTVGLCFSNSSPGEQTDFLLDLCHMCTFHMCASIFVCACRGRWLLSGTFSWYSLPYYLFVYLLIYFQTVHSLNLNSVRLLASEFQGSSWAYLPRVGPTVQDTTPNTSFFFPLKYVCWGCELSSFTLVK